MPRRPQEFQTIRSEGGLLPPDLLRRVIDPKAKLEGTRAEDYGLPKGERLNEVITQSWNRLRKHWGEFRAAAVLLPEGESATGLTNDKWNLPLFRELGFGLLPTTAGPEIGGRTYAINRFFGPVPIHLIGCGLSLDRRTAGARGAAAVNPHGLVQEFLNRSTGHFWAILSNGLRLRFLRDNQALSRQSYLEFDLEAMFSGEVYSDFVLLWLTAHATRFAPRDGNRPESCWLEQWTKVAEEEGTRALAALSGGVERALQVLGQGLVGHPKNTALREALRSGTLTLRDFHGELLRVVYRFIFLFVAEDRTLEGHPLIHPIDESEAARLARERYAAHYSTARLRDLASRIKGSRHGDLWQQFQLTVGALSGDERFAPMREALALPILGSLLWNPESTAHLNGPGLATPGAELTNFDFLEALRHLAFTRQGKVLRPVDYKNLGSEEFGGVYEGLLELTPQISSDGARFFFVELAGNERKTSGSYYTPDSLVQCLLDTALDPVVEDRIKGRSAAEAAEAILSLKVCDPAVGSGHFLVGAAHRLARHLARVRALAQGESEPSPLLYQTALRDIISHCLYGVDLNPMAVELCKVTLWLEATEPGKPLSFLDHHIRTGNGLLGTTPDLIAAGLPDDTFNAIEGDDRTACAELKKRNKKEREGFGPLFEKEEQTIRDRLRHAATQIEAMDDSQPAALQQKEAAFTTSEAATEYRHAKLIADLWCAAFVIKKTYPATEGEAKSAPSAISDLPSPVEGHLLHTQDELFGQPTIAPKAASKKQPRTKNQEQGTASGITTGTLRNFVQGQTLPEALEKEVTQLASQYRFFHWHLAFPQVFDQGGFDCILGNPPWDQAELEDTEWFSSRRPDIACAANDAEKRKLIKELAKEDPRLFGEFMEAKRSHSGFSHYARNSGAYILCGQGRMNTASLFSEAISNRIRLSGHVGIVVPTSIATDDSTKEFFTNLFVQHRIKSLIGFHNGERLFPQVRPHQQFCLLTLGSNQSGKAAFAFSLGSTSAIQNPERIFDLALADLYLFNPNTGTCPVFTTATQMELTRLLYRSVPVLIRESSPASNPWGLVFKQGLFNMATDSSLFKTQATLESEGWLLKGPNYEKDDDQYLPLFDPKMAQQFNHRAADLGHSGRQFRKISKEKSSEDLLKDPLYIPTPIYWVPKAKVEHELEGWSHRWLLGFKDVTGTTSTRIGVFSIIPLSGVGHKFPLVLTQADAAGHALLLANLNALIIEFVLRLKFHGLSLAFFYLKQLPIIPPATYAQPCPWANDPKSEIPNPPSLRDWLLPRVLELTYTAWDLEAFASDCGWSGPPFRWDEERRFLLRCELDAAFFHLYLGPQSEWQQQPEALTRAFPTPRHAVSYIMDTFPIVKRKDESKHGHYRTKDTILQIYDALGEAMTTGKPYQTLMNPPPADPACCHPPKSTFP
jgi:hypothetical protein